MTPFFTRHVVHIAIIAIPALAIVVALGPEIWRKHRDTHPTAADRWSRPPRSAAIMLLAAGTVGAAVVHASIVREHFSESWMYGTFFVVCSLTQFAYAGLILARPSRRLVAAGLVGNAAVIALWATTRFVAIPVGPAAGTREPIGVLDVVATSCEVVAVLAAVVAFRHLTRPEPLTRLYPALPPVPPVPGQRVSSPHVVVARQPSITQAGQTSNVRLVTKT